MVDNMNDLEAINIIDLSEISFDDDETWLYKCPQVGRSASIFTKQQTDKVNSSHAQELTQDSCSKDSNHNDLTNSQEFPSNRTFLEEAPELKPLQFDLSVTSEYFRLIAANLENDDTFQNESLPSLVNSMCSSTFTNLMESSFIKNDPVLKQICDTDFTTSILSQGSEPSLLSNSHYDEFLTKVSQSNAFKSMELADEMTCSGDASYTAYKKDGVVEDKNTTQIMDFEEYHDASDANFLEGQNQEYHNGTFKKNTKLSSATFRKTDYSRPMLGRNNTYEIDPLDIELAQNQEQNNGAVKKNTKLSSATFRKRTDHSRPMLGRNNTFEINPEDIELAQNQEQNRGAVEKNTKLINETFRETEYSRPMLGPNNTYEIDPEDIEPAQNVTHTLGTPKSTRPYILKHRNETIIKSNSMEDFKNTTILKDSCNNDLNRYASKESNLEVECNNSRSGSKKSLDCSIGSVDSLDRMSTLSSSSKGSNKMLNMEEVEAIAEKQAQSLQVMSTPKQNWCNTRFSGVMWEHSIISPIVTGEIHSDSGDSNDDYKSVKSSFSKISIDSNPVKQTRSLVSLQNPADARKFKSINTMANPSNLGRMPLRGSASNLQKYSASTTTTTTQSQIRVPSVSNLKTMRPSLKGSYTSLKPVNPYLPVAPPINAPSQGQNSTFLAPANPHAQDQGRGVRNPGTNNGVIVKTSRDGVFLKPSGPLRSGLPRPTSSIPKPVSRRFIPEKKDPSRK